MQTTPVNHETLRTSVIAVPPLCRDADMKICRGENQKLVSHIEAGGVTTLLYGGNANLYHVRLSEYATLLEILQQIAGGGQCGGQGGGCGQCGGQCGGFGGGGGCAGQFPRGGCGCC